MEKFSTFNDERSGVNPFTLPPPPRLSIGQNVLRTLLACIRLVIVLPLLITLLTTNGVLSAIPVPSVSYTLRRLLERPLARALLFCMGVHELPVVVANKLQLRVKPSKSAPSQDVRAGDIIMINCCSYLDILILDALFAPAFTSHTRAGALSRTSLFHALTTFGDSTQSRGAADASAETTTDETVMAVCRDGAAPLLVAAEGAPTNNRAILTFSSVASHIASSVVRIARGDGARVRLRVPLTHVIALRYTYTHTLAQASGRASGAGANEVPPVYVAGGKLRHALALLGQRSLRVSVHRLAPGHDPQPADFLGLAPGGGQAADASKDAADSDVPQTWPAAARDALAQLVKNCRPVALGAADFDRFAEAYAAVTSGARRKDE